MTQQINLKNIKQTLKCFFLILKRKTSFTFLCSILQGLEAIRPLLLMQASLLCVSQLFLPATYNFFFSENTLCGKATNVYARMDKHRRSVYVWSVWYSTFCFVCGCVFECCVCVCIRVQISHCFSLAIFTVTRQGFMFAWCKNCSTFFHNRANKAFKLANSAIDSLCLMEIKRKWCLLASVCFNECTSESVS